MSLLEDPCYQPMSGVCRSIHFSDLDHCYKKRQLIPHRISSNDIDTDDIGKVLWFGPERDLSEHNMYGNVSFTMDMCRLLSRFGSSFYYLDSLEYKTHIATRVLLSDQDYDCFDYVDFRKHGSPLKRKKWRSVVSCYSEKYGYNHPHEVEIGIEVDKDDCKWLFNNCSVESNDHSEANTKSTGRRYVPHVCHRYNLFGKKCPYALTEYDAQRKIEEYFPDLLDDDEEEDHDI